MSVSISDFKMYRVLLMLSLVMHQVEASEGRKVFNLSSNLACKISDEKLHLLLHKSSIMQTTASEWATTHKISDWHQTEWLAVAFGEDNSDMLKYNIPFSDSLEHAKYEYMSYIHFPKILSTLIEVNVRLPVQKHVYLSRNVIYTITHLQNIPVIDSCVIFSRIKIMDSGVVLSQNTVMYDELPWYALVFQTAIEAKVEESLTLYHTIFSKNLCEP